MYTRPFKGAHCAVRTEILLKTHACRHIFQKRRQMLVDKTVSLKEQTFSQPIEVWPLLQARVVHRDHRKPISIHALRVEP